VWRVTFPGCSYHGDDPQTTLRKVQRTGSGRRSSARLRFLPDGDEVKAWARKIEGDIDHGGHFGMSRIRTLADAIDRFQKSATSIKTADDRDRHLEWWRANFGALRVIRFDEDVIADGRNRLMTQSIERRAKRPPRHRAPQTVRHYMMSLSACLDYVRRIRWIERNLMGDADVPPVAPARIRWLSADERARLLEACAKSGNPDLSLVVRIALASGARQAEILGLRWPWIDFDRECAFLPREITKTDEARVMPLPGAVLEDLRKRAKVRRIGSDMVFSSPEKPDQSRNIRNAWQVARKVAKLPDFRFQDLRHSAATEMLRPGVDSRIVATVLGHRSMNMMRRYAHVAPELVVAAAKKAQV